MGHGYALREGHFEQIYDILCMDIQDKGSIYGILQKTRPKKHYWSDFRTNLPKLADLSHF